MVPKRWVLREAGSPQASQVAAGLESSFRGGPMYRFFLMLCLLALLASPATGQDDRRPNIIFILADDLGYGDLGSYGQTVIQTPELDRMAAEGIRFTQFYAGATVCAPSRSVLMTGQHMGHTHVRGNAPGPRMDAQSLRDVDVTVAEVLKAAGYSTALFGKWGLGEVDLQGHPLKQGFDTFFGYLNQVHAHNYYPEFLWKGLERMPLRNKVQRVSRTYGGFTGGWATERNEYSHDVMHARGDDLVGGSGGRAVLHVPSADDSACQQRGHAWHGRRCGDSRSRDLLRQGLAGPGQGTGGDDLPHGPRCRATARQVRRAGRCRRHLGDVLVRQRSAQRSQP